MKTHLALWLVLFALIHAAACGSSSSGGTVACTTGSGTSQSCFETSSSNATASTISIANMDCATSGGVASEMCPRTSADGGCKIVTSQGSVTASITTWYYTGNAAAEMQACTSNGDTWIAP